MFSVRQRKLSPVSGERVPAETSLEIANARSGSRGRGSGGGGSTIDHGTTDVGARKTKCPRRDSATTKMRAGINKMYHDQEENCFQRED